MGKVNSNIPIDEKLFSKWTLFLCLGGLGINVLLTKLVTYFQLPLYLDNAGSILVGALGGVLPGIVVGFLSNLISYFSEPISLFYGLITVVIAYLATSFSQKGYFKTIPGCLKITACYVFWGGGIGSLFTWFLFGGKISGLAEPYANILVTQYGFVPFFAQLFTDMVIDIPDKLLTVFLAALILKFYPKALYDKFALSYLYDRSPEEAEITKKKEQEHFRVESLDKRLVRIVISCVFLVSITSVIISGVYHNARLEASYENQVSVVAHQAALLIDGDAVDYFVKFGKNTNEYMEVEQELYKLRDTNKFIKYLFVYKVGGDGVQVVFDLDSPDLLGSAPGTVIPNEQGFNGHMDDFLAGRDIAPGFSSGPYGYLITGYAPIKDSKGNIIAYAGADIGMDSYIYDMLTFIIQIIAMIFTLTMVIAFLSLWYLRRRVQHPLNSIMNLIRKLDKIKPEEWLESSVWKNKEEIKTGDEIETLYTAICKLEENSAHYVKRIIETEQQLAESEKLERVNNQLKDAMAKADEATKVKSDFYSRMSHDMRTPMNGILGLVHLSKGEEDASVLRDNMGKIGVASKYLLGLINDTLDMSRIESERLTLVAEPIKYEDFMDNILTMIRPTLEKKHIDFQIKVDGVPNDQVILADEMRINQILMNLLSNAVKFTKEYGTIKFTVEQLEKTSDHVINRITIADNGYGMSEKFIEESIFTPFSQERNEVTSEYAGTGLGLAIVKNLVELMGGNITVTSALGKGTTFTLILPFKLAPKEDLVKKEQMNKEVIENVDLGILQGKTVLLCEDHPLNKEIVIKLLTKKGVTVEWAANGQEGVELFQKSPLQHFAAVLMDIRMPIMTGLEAAKAIRSLPRSDAKSVPIIAMTANAFEEDIIASRNAGMNAHLAKPLNPQVMFNTLAEMLRQQENLEEK